jgi:hypothetical protein
MDTRKLKSSNSASGSASPPPSPPNPREQEQTKMSLEQLTEDLNKRDLKELAPTVGAKPIEKETIERIIQRLAHRCFLHPVAAFAAIALLFLKGAASKSAPDRMFVEVVAIDNSIMKVRGTYARPI